MLKRIMVAATAIGTVVFSAPVALADEPTFGCSVQFQQYEPATGQSYEGAAWGYVIHAGDSSATVRCYIAVNGSEISSTPTGTGVTAGRVTFSAGDTDVVTLHAEVCTSHGCVIADFETSHSQIPPQEVIDALFAVYGLVNPGGPDNCNGAVDLYCTDPQGDGCIVWVTLFCVFGA